MSEADDPSKVVDPDYVGHKIAAMLVELSRQHSRSDSQQSTKPTNRGTGKGQTGAGGGKRKGEAKDRGTGKRQTGAGGGKRKGKAKEAESDDDADPEPEFYDVEEIRGQRTVDGKTEVWVKWEGYESGEDSWEPLINLQDNTVYKNWLAEQKGRAEASGEGGCSSAAAAPAKRGSAREASKLPLSRAQWFPHKLMEFTLADLQQEAKRWPEITADVVQAKIGNTQKERLAKALCGMVYRRSPEPRSPS